MTKNTLRQFICLLSGIGSILSLTRCDITYMAVLVWAFVGIADKQVVLLWMQECVNFGKQAGCTIVCG